MLFGESGQQRVYVNILFVTGHFLRGSKPSTVPF